MASKLTWHFPWKLSASSLSLKSGLRNSRLHNLFVKHIATQFISNVAYYGKSLSPPKPGKGRKTRITRKEWGTGRGEILQTQVSKMSLIARRYWRQRTTQIIEIGLNWDLIQFWYLCSQAIIGYVWQNLTQHRAIAIHYLKPDTAIPIKGSFLPWFLSAFGFCAGQCMRSGKNSNPESRSVPVANRE